MLFIPIYIVYHGKVICQALWITNHNWLKLDKKKSGKKYVSEHIIYTSIILLILDKKKYEKVVKILKNCRDHF